MIFPRSQKLELVALALKPRVSYNLTLLPLFSEEQVWEAAGVLFSSDTELTLRVYLDVNNVGILSHSCHVSCFIEGISAGDVQGRLFSCMDASKGKLAVPFPNDFFFVFSIFIFFSSLPGA